jgi:hypothetical protein
VILFETAKKKPGVFTSPKSRSLARKCLEGIDNLAKTFIGVPGGFEEEFQVCFGRKQSHAPLHSS